MSLVSITSSKNNIANISTVMSELNIRLNDNQSTVIGYQSGTRIKGLYNSVLGYKAARESITTNAFTVFGYGAGEQVNADSNTFIGTLAGERTNSGANNVFVGAESGAKNSVGSRNVYVGCSSGSGCSGNANVCVGDEAGRALSSFSSNICIGIECDSVSEGGVLVGCCSRNSGLNSVLLGHHVTNSGSNCFIVNTNTSSGYTNNHSSVIYIDGRIIGDAHHDVSTDSNVYRLKYVGDEIAICEDSSTGESLLTANRSLATLNSRLHANTIRASKVDVFVPGGESNVAWTMCTGSPYFYPSGQRAADLHIKSSNSNAVVFTDEFAPELFNFTAKHRCNFVETTGNTINYNKDMYTGLIAVSVGSYANLDGGTKPTIDEALPVLELSVSSKDKRVFGVISGFEDDTTEIDKHVRTFRLGHLRFQVPKLLSKQKVIVNSLGEGGIWVCSANGPLKNGDFICTSPLPGHGMKQDEPHLMNFTCAKSTCDCSFEEEDVVLKNGYKCAFIGCSYKC